MRFDKNHGGMETPASPDPLRESDGNTMGWKLGPWEWSRRPAGSGPHPGRSDGNTEGWKKVAPAPNPSVFRGRWEHGGMEMHSASAGTVSDSPADP